MVEGKKGQRKNGQGKKWPMEQMADGKKRKNNNLKSNFSANANIFVRNFFLQLLNLIFEPILSELSD